MTELGKRLKEAREAKNISLDELQSITKIQKRYLVGIEEGNYSMMPGKFYVRAFIKQYAEAVGIQPEELFEEFKEDIPSTYNENLPDQLSRVKTRQTGIAPGSSKIFDILPKVLIGVFVIGAFALLWYFMQQNAGDVAKDPVENDNNPISIEDSEKLNEDEGEDPDASEEGAQSEGTDDASEEGQEEEPVEEKPAQEVTSIQSSGKNTVFELKNTETFKLKVVSTGETWINIINGSNQSVFQGMLKKGATESHEVDFTNESHAVIIVGFAPATEIYINDQKLEYTVPPSEQVRQDITIRYTKANE